MRVPAMDTTAAWRRCPPPTLRVLLSLAMWAAVVWVAVLWRLGGFSLIDPNEAHYAQLTREMLRTDRWLVPLLDMVFTAFLFGAVACLLVRLC